MNTSTQLLIGLSSMIMLSVLIGSIFRKKNNSLLEYFWADNDLKNSFVINLILSTSFSMNGLLYQTWLGYSIGFSAVLIQVIWCFSYFLLSFKADKIRQLSNKGTLHGNIGEKFGLKAEKLASIASILGFTLQIGWELIVGISVFMIISPDDVSFKIILMLVLVIICAVYTMLGGLRGNVFANRFQNFFAFLSIGIIIYLLFNNYENYNYSMNSIFELKSFNLLFITLGIGGFITNAIFSLSWQFVDMSTWQNIAAIRNTTNASKKALRWSAFWVFLFPGVAGTFIGIFLRNFHNLDPDSLITEIINIVSLYPAFGIIVAAGFTGIMLSTIDGLLLASSQAITWDLVFKDKVKEILAFRFNQKKQKLSDQQKDSSEVSTQTNMPVINTEMEDKERNIIAFSRIFVLLVALSGGFLVYWFTQKFEINIFDLVYVVVVSQMILLPVVISVLYDVNNNKKYGFLSILFGLVIGIGLISYGIFYKNNTVLTWTPLIAMSFSFFTLFIQDIKILIIRIFFKLFSFRKNQK